MKVDAPIEKIPVFVKAGSIIPTVEDIQYAGQKPEEPMKIYVYPGADAAFTLYESCANIAMRFDDISCDENRL